jgi:PKD repeat protein
MITSHHLLKTIIILGLSAGLLAGCGKDEQNTNNHLPVARFTLDITRGDVNTTFNFDASSVTDEEDPASSLEVRWDWENDGIFDTEFSTTKIATHRYTTPGLYFPLLQVRDTKAMTDSTTNMLTVVTNLDNLPPNRPIYSTPPDYQTYMELEVVFKWTCSDPEDDDLSFDLWVGRSRATLAPVKTGITDYSIENGNIIYQTTYNFLDYSREYHWRIFARDSAGNYTAGHIWRFTTRPK